VWTSAFSRSAYAPAATGVRALGSGGPGDKPLGCASGRAYSGGMKVSFTCAAARAISSPVAAA
jgi:hypothetical protein